MANGTLKVSNIQTSSGSGTITIGQSGETVDFSNGTMTLNSSMKNTPAFGAYAGSDQSSIADDTWTKVAMNTEFYDTDSKYDTSTYRFTPGTVGKYMFGASIFLEQSNTNESCAMSFYKNGAKNIYTEQLLDNTNRLHLTGVMDLDADDYVELYAVVNMNSGNTWTINQDGAVTNRVFWYGYKLIGA